MYTIEAFNHMLVEFLADLCQVFPDFPYLKKYQTILNTAILMSPESIVEKFMGEVKPFAREIQQKDESFFSKAHGEIMDSLNIKELWSQDLPDSTRENIWKYLNTLFVIGTLIQSVDKDMLSGIENMASQCMNNPGSLDMSTLMGSLSTLMGDQSMNFSLPPSKKK